MNFGLQFRLIRSPFQLDQVVLSCKKQVFGDLALRQFSNELFLDRIEFACDA